MDSLTSSSQSPSQGGSPSPRRWAALAALAALILGASAAPQQTLLLGDINDRPLGTASSGAREFVALGNRVVCATALNGVFAIDVASGAATVLAAPSQWTPANLVRIGSRAYWTSGPSIWETDGTVAGTRAYAVSNRDVTQLIVGGTKLYFVKYSQVSGPELGVLETTSGRLAYELQSFSEIRNLTALGETLYFNAILAGTGRELWSWDGTSSRAALVHEFSPGPDSSQFGPMAAKYRAAPFPPYLVVDATPSRGRRQLWVVHSTGVTALGEYAVREFFDEPGTDRFLFTGAESSASLGWEPYASFGTATTTGLVVDIAPGPSSSAPRFLAELGSRVYFSAIDGVHGSELWATDGTAAGTVLVSDICPGSAGSGLAPAYGPAVVDVGGAAVLMFTADDGTTGLEPWICDGTGSGTRRLADLYPGPEHSLAGAFIGVPGSRAVFAATDRLLGVEPWITDGTSAGTRVLVDLDNSPGGRVTADSDPAFGVRYGSRLLFAADDGRHGVELWENDGSAGTQLRADLVPGVASSNPRDFTIVGDKLFFTADDPGGVRRLWVQGGASTPPAVVSAGTRDPTELCAVGDILFFQNQDPATGGELWKSDGTRGGTALVRDLRPGSASSDPTAIVAFGGRAVFSAFHASTGRELWSSDGTANGTLFVRDIVRGVVGSAPEDLTVVGDMIFFTASRSGEGRELWRSNGTAGGTALVADIRIGATGSNPTELTRVRERLFLMADDGARGREVWVSDGTTAGTHIVRDVWPGSTRGALGSLIGCGDLLFFQGMDQARGPEPWRSDGTPGGTFELGDLTPGAAGSYPEFEVASGSRFVWFSARTPDQGRELWRSDGTAAGTVLVADIRPGSDSSSPTALGVIRERLVFAAVHPDKGREPFVSDIGATTVPYGFGCSHDQRVPSLYVDDLVLGGVADVEMFRVRPGSVALLGLSALPLRQPLRLDPGCWLYPDGATVALWGPYSAPGGTLRLRLAVPNAPVLDRLELVWQGLSFPSPSPLGFDMSAGVVSTCGR